MEKQNVEMRSESAARRLIWSPPTLPRLQNASLRYLLAGAAVIGLTSLCSLLLSRLDLANVAMLYLLNVLVVAVAFGRGPAILTSLLSVAAFDFFFVPPSLDFVPTDNRHLITLGVMLAVAFVMSGFTARLREEELAALEREKKTAFLLALSRELAAAQDANQIRQVTETHLSKTFEVSVSLFLRDSEGRIPSYEAANACWRDMVQTCLDTGQPCGAGSSKKADYPALFVPLKASRATIGILELRPKQKNLSLEPSQLQLLETLSHQIATALERTHLIRAANEAALKVESEQMRNALLSSVSHDLRTPLSTITGAASALVEDDLLLHDRERKEMAQSIYDEAERLNRLIDNLVYATRVESHAIELRREWIAIEEVVGSALIRLKKIFHELPVTASIPPDLPLLRADGLLIEQVLLNIFENALRYRSAASTIELCASRDGNSVVVRISNAGPAIQAGQEERIFERFYRGEAADKGRGLGLGLFICRGIVNAHGGRVWAEAHDLGTSILFALPFEGTGIVETPDTPAPLAKGEAEA